MAKARFLKTIQKNIPFVNLSTSFIFLALIFIVSIILFFIVNKSIEGLSNSITSLENDKKKKIVYFYMNGCGHCKDFSPTWDKFVKISPISTYKFESNDAKTLIKKYNVSGFPTIVLLDEKNNLIKTFNGERTVDALKQFVT